MNANDTTNEAEGVLIDIFRRMPIEQKWRQLGDLYRTARILHEAGVRQRNPSATDRDVVEDWLSLTIDPELLREFRELRNESVGRQS